MLSQQNKHYFFRL